MTCRSPRITFDIVFSTKKWCLSANQSGIEKRKRFSPDFLAWGDCKPLLHYKLPYIKDYHIKRHSLTSLREELGELKEAYGKESTTVAEQWKTLENDEQTLEQFKDDLEKMEHERNQINQDKIACRDKLEKGTKLFEEMAGESSSWKRELAAINDEIDNLLGNVLVYAASICLLPAFHFDKRYVCTHPFVI